MNIKKIFISNLANLFSAVRASLLTSLEPLSNAVCVENMFATALQLCDMVIIFEIKKAYAAAKVFLFLSKLVIVSIHDIEDRDFGSMSCHIIFASQLNGALEIFLSLKSGPSLFLSLTMSEQREQKDTREDAAIHDHESYTHYTVPS